MKTSAQDTISAIATAPGKAGVGIVRLSGPLSRCIAEKMTGFVPVPRFAHYTPFLNPEEEVIDEGILLYFAAPNSFTGEDVVEFQAHGGPIVLDRVLKSALSLGARLARPGEFSERAFLNDKMDLTQAEAIADLINAESEKAAQSALNSLQGEFSREIHQLKDQLIQLRMYVESAIDFPEEEIDFLAEGDVMEKLDRLINQVELVFQRAKQGALLRDGMKVVIAGRPNAGKSSLLNALAEREAAIVTAIEGTTRDVLKEHILIDGMPLHIVDTAGLRENPDEVEQIGIQKAKQEMDTADRILLLVDSLTEPRSEVKLVWPEFMGPVPPLSKITVVRNKIDCTQEESGLDESNSVPVLRISVKEGRGVDTLRQHLKHIMGYANLSESTFVARRRHLTCLERAMGSLHHGQAQLRIYKAGELLAEDLRSAQDNLNEITGEFTNDDLLSEIFSSFCIGK